MNVEPILEIILQSKNLETFKKNINNLVVQNPKCFYRRELLIGNLVGRYDIYQVFSSGGDIPNIENFNLEEKEVLKILSNIKENIFEIIMSDNSYKNIFYEKEEKIINFTKDFTKEDVLKLFDYLVNGNENINSNDEIKIGLLLAIVYKIATSKEEYQKLVAGLEAKLNPTIVNHVADLDVVYSSSFGLGYYQSDTQNQISASVYSASFFAKDNVGNFLGIGFNADSITPESILMSSKKYMTTNAGVYNIDNSNDPNDYNSPYSELVENDGYSEVVLARRGEDFDSKAAYVFVVINSENIEGHPLYQRAKEYAT